MSNPPVSIRALLDAQGTDKGRYYGGLYGVLLSPIRECIRCVVEIGIGTMAMVANGYAANNYRPGASLRAWRNFLPNADVHGVDVAPETRIDSEPRITTHLCDSRNPDQVAIVLKAVAPSIPDLIIDDGLHTPSAQIATFRNFFPALRASGIYVVEDIMPADVRHVLPEINRSALGCDVFVKSNIELVDANAIELEGGFAIVVRKTVPGV